MHEHNRLGRAVAGMFGRSDPTGKSTVAIAEVAAGVDQASAVIGHFASTHFQTVRYLP